MATGPSVSFVHILFPKPQCPLGVPFLTVTPSWGGVAQGSTPPPPPRTKDGNWTVGKFCAHSFPEAPMSIGHPIFDRYTHRGGVTHGSTPPVSPRPDRTHHRPTRARQYMQGARHAVWACGNSNIQVGDARGRSSLPLPPPDPPAPVLALAAGSMPADQGITLTQRSSR